jgi:hypothetical protein
MTQGLHDDAGMDALGQQQGRCRVIRGAQGVERRAQKEPTRLPSRITVASARMELTIATMTMSR